MLTVPSPISGTVIEANRALDDHPERGRRDPYNRGWLVALESVRWAIYVRWLPAGEAGARRYLSLLATGGGLCE